MSYFEKLEPQESLQLLPTEPGVLSANVLHNWRALERARSEYREKFQYHEYGLALHPPDLSEQMKAIWPRTKYWRTKEGAPTFAQYFNENRVRFLEIQEAESK